MGNRLSKIYTKTGDDGTTGLVDGSRCPKHSARIAAILPSPRKRSVTDPSVWTRRRAASILDGAATIRRDGRSACFED